MKLYIRKIIIKTYLLLVLQEEKDVRKSIYLMKNY